MQARPAVVIGGGVIGCAIAWELARRGRPVLLIERDQPGSGASGAAAGMLSPLAEARGPGPFVDLALASLELYAGFVAAVREASGVDPCYVECGKLCVAFNAAEAGVLAESREWQRRLGHATEWLEPSQAREMEPGLSRDVVGAVHLPRDYQVDNRRLVHALWLAAEQAGVRFLRTSPAIAIHSRPAADASPAGGVPAVHSVELAGGERIPADDVVLAAGCWSQLLSGLPRQIPLQPVPGQLLALATIPPLFRRMVASPRCYLVPRRDGRLLVGATTEEPTFHSPPTAGGARQLLAAALEIAPALERAPFLETWSGLRPATPDHLPVLGEDPDLSGLYYATGHYRNGILLAPITASLIADSIMGREPAIAMAPFRPERF